jgi:hypothetical protein
VYRECCGETATGTARADGNTSCQASCGGFPEIACSADAGREARRAADGTRGALRAARAGFT